jgi:CTP:molybdopterin cytidylyltransferase MocA
MGFPKALLKYRRQTFVDHLVSLLGEYCAPVIVVLGAAAEEIQRRASQPAEFVLNPRYQTGQTSSMQCGLRSAPPEAEGVLFTLVDHPAVEASTLERLLAEPRPLVRVPRYQGRRGHPVWFHRSLIPEFLALPETAAARDVVRSHAGDTEFLDLDDPGIVADIDDPATYRALLESGS